MKNNIFEFPSYFYSSLRCSQKDFDDVWNSISDDKKKNINMWAAISLVCLKLSDNNFYNVYDKLEENRTYTFSAQDIITDADYLFQPVYEGYEKIINEQNHKHIDVKSAEEVIQLLNRKFNTSVDASFMITDKNKISIIMAYAHKKHMERHFKIFRDVLFPVGWYMSMCDPVTTKHKKVTNTPGESYYELVFEPVQIPEATVDIKNNNLSSFDINDWKKVIFMRIKRLIKHVFKKNS